ncbi:MAG: RlmE family RNA methyltransferase [Alphaproteobacteria bacterium]
MTTGKKKGGSRASRVRIKSAKRRGVSSRRWLERQLNDPYVIQAKEEGYRSRAAFKLLELDDRFHILAPGSRVVDLGAAPGGWTQVAVERVKAGSRKGGRVVAVDINGMEPVQDAQVIEADVLDIDTPALIQEALGGPADIVLSDMASPATGHSATDRLRIIGLCEAALAFAGDVLAPDGAFICKVLGSGADAGLLADIKRAFAMVKHAKPPASRDGSAELYLVATSFRGHKSDES